MRRTAWLAAACVGLAGGAFGQATAPTIEHRGVGRAEARPEHVDFWLQQEFAQGSFAASVKQALEFLPNVRQALVQSELKPIETWFSAPALDDVTKAKAVLLMRLRFSMAPYMNLENGPELYGKLCDDMAALANALNCEIRGPELGVSDPAPYEQEAVGRAIENALPVAAAAADLMSAQVTAIERVIIETCAWTREEEDVTTRPTMRRLVCTASVRVVYSFAATAP